MAFEHKEGSGSLFKNKFKTKENQPDRNGDFKLNGKLYKISGWLKKDKNGEDYLSLSIKEKEDRAAAPVREGRRPSREITDEEIPF